ncbi:MAG: hydrolase CocE/NonD family protein [Rhodospirillales bacterium]|nr:hydrolase CocE/NonD family protein [Rhodospirillales bacterium]
MTRVFLLLLALLVTSRASAEDYQKYAPEILEKMLKDSSVIDEKVLVPMRDGIGLSTTIFRPKNASGKLPIIFVRTPYNFQVLKGTELAYAVAAVKHGYAFVMQNERGRYYSQGEFELLGYPRTDGYDALSWLAQQSWSNGKVGTLGCSSTAEWQLALAAMKHPAHAAAIPMASGAGIGRVGRFQEQGNWYTGGVPRTLFFVWLYGVDNPLRAQLPQDLDPAMRAHVGKYNDLAANKPKVDWTKRIGHLPLTDLLTGLGEPPGTYEKFIMRKPNDPAWFKSGLYQDNEDWGVPTLWFNSWYDVSSGPNMELFNNLRARSGIGDNQYAVVAPTTHCQFQKLDSNTKIGDRLVGDASFDVEGAVFAWFDRWLKNDRAAFPDSTPRVRYFTIGENKWNAATQWPPREAKKVRFYLHSDGKANSLYGDGRLDQKEPGADEAADRFTYDPLVPVQTIGGNDCCNGALTPGGIYDQRVIEARQDVLVYSSEKLKAPLTVTGWVTPVLQVGSDANDTDFAVKLVDVLPDGTAYIVADTIIRARYRDGYDKEVMMKPGETYRLQLTPVTTSTQFGEGHRIRVEITSSNFPKFARNLNSGGDNVSETNPVSAHNELHHTAKLPSFLELDVMQ